MSKSTKCSAEREFKAEDGCGQDSMGKGFNIRRRIAGDKQAENVKDALQLTGPILSLTGYETLSNSVLDQMIETNLCCLKTLLHYAGFEILSEFPELEIQCQHCKKKVLIKADETAEKYDLVMPKNKMLCNNVNCSSESFKNIIFKHLHTLNRTGNLDAFALQSDGPLCDTQLQSDGPLQSDEPLQSDSPLRSDNQIECDSPLQSDSPTINIKDQEPLDIFKYREVMELCIKFIDVRNHLMKELSDRDSKLKEKDLEIQDKACKLDEKTSEIECKNVEIEKRDKKYNDLEKFAIPQWNSHIEERDKLNKIIEDLKDCNLKKDEKIKNLEKDQCRLQQECQDLKLHAEQLQSLLAKTQQENQYLLGKNETLEDQLKNFMANYLTTDKMKASEQDDLKAVEKQDFPQSLLSQQTEVKDEDLVINQETCPVDSQDLNLSSSLQVAQEKTNINQNMLQDCRVSEGQADKNKKPRRRKKQTAEKSKPLAEGSSQSAPAQPGNLEFQNLKFKTPAKNP